MNATTLSVVFTALIAAGCATNNNQPAQNPVTQASQLAEVQKLQQIFDDYFEVGLKLNPVSATFMGRHEFNADFDQPLTQALIDKKLQIERDFLQRIQQIDPSNLSSQDKLSYQVFKIDREQGIRESAFANHLMPLNQLFSNQIFFPMLGSGQSAQPFNTKKGYLNFISRAEGFVDYMDSVIAMYREGMKLGIVQAKVIVRKIILQLQMHVVAKAEDSVFYGPINNLPDALTQAERIELTQAYTRLIEDKLVPCYRKLAEFLQNEYLPIARDSIGQSALPNGKAWYEFMIQSHTTLPLTAEEVHKFGKAEVKRILSEMVTVKQQVGFDGSLAEFFTFLKQDPRFYFENQQQVVDAYTQVKDRINAAVPKLFEIFPKADYIVKPVEAFRAASATGASYQAPALDGSRPGIFYINTHNLKAQPKFLVETLSIHEAAPGHHFQIALQQELKALPNFRRFGSYTVFTEGWALYAESLGKQLGLFSDPYMWYGRLVDEQLRAMRLVIDTGIHAFGWSRQQAIDYMEANSSMAESDIVAEVERYISWPGQALAYKVGQRAIEEMRDQAKKIMGEKFDIRQFHTQVLIDGALPMPVLKQKILNWARQNS